MKKFLIFAVLLALTSPLFAQTNVRAWYAQGQVWVVWESDSPLPDWYAVYAKSSAFSSTNDATFVGRLHRLEYLCTVIKEQVDSLLPHKFQVLWALENTK
ncbi:MAG: hypothetical protein IPM81_01315 [Saprospirales bacterium]|nr:hypothetical protein [Saprospirales bacterium]